MAKPCRFNRALWRLKWPSLAVLSEPSAVKMAKPGRFDRTLWRLIWPSLAVLTEPSGS